VLPRRMGAGAWQYHDMSGYTSVGAGSSVVPVRLNCPPEITLHCLRRSWRQAKVIWRHWAIAASGICIDGHIPVCTENLNPDMVVMKFAQNQERFEGSGSLNRCFAN